MCTIKQSPTLEQYLHEVNQKLSIKEFESYFRKYITIDKSKSPQFAAIIIDSNNSISEFLSTLDPRDESILQQFLNLSNRPSDTKPKALVVLDICNTDNGFIDNDIVNFAYIVQENLAEKGILLLDYILASENIFVSLKDDGVL